MGINLNVALNLYIRIAALFSSETEACCMDLSFKLVFENIATVWQDCLLILQY